MPAQTLRLVPPPVRLTDAPAPTWTHVARLTDDTGLLAHAHSAIARRDHGYRVSDAARGLLVASREFRPAAQVVGLAERYLALLLHAQAPDGTFHDHLGFDRRWLDEPSTGEAWGHAMWGLGTAAARSTVPWIRRGADDAFRLGMRLRSPRPRAMALAGLGAAEVLRADPRAAAAADLLADAATVVGVPGCDPSWAWPEPELTYANPALAEVVVAAGDLLGDEVLLADGLRMLAWLCDVQDHAGHLSPVPVGGLRPSNAGAASAAAKSTDAFAASLSTDAFAASRPTDAFAAPQSGAATDRDGFRAQRPAEAAATADACATAAAVTGDDRWDGLLFQALAWFLGDNDAGRVMYDPLTGGGYDALTPDGPDHDQGAEATLALLSALQHARALTARRPTVTRRPAGPSRPGRGPAAWQP
ncbi:glycosyltransferase [Krasilnikovia sp. M28-CT-15]|uniref:glycosyltransferase n=1 Tax=Krasilnikovia sp. M28-CT-15 TaxID=3373540 RepID=UPI003875FCEA